MAYCKQCGAYIPIGETTCPACGYDPEAEARREQEAKEQAEREERRRAQEQSWAEQERKREEEARRRAQQGYGTATQSQSQGKGQTWVPPWSQGTSQNGYQQSSYQGTGTYNYDMQNRAQDSVDNQKLSIFSYLGMLFLIPLIARKDDPFARFHANQGLVLFLTTTLINTLSGWWFLDGIVATAASLFGLYCTVKGISNVLNGKMEPLPLIGHIKLLK